MMHKLLRTTVLVGAAVFGAPFGASAASITYQLDTIISATPTPSPYGSYGSVTLSDNAIDPNKVDVTVDLVGSGQRVQVLILNYNNALFNNSTPFVITGSATSVEIDEDDIKADGYSAGLFDLEFPRTGNIGFEPITLTIALASVNLNPSDFDFKDTNNLLFNAVHIGACGPSSPATCTPGTTGGNSIWVGSSGRVAVPEPASLALFGAGLAALGLVASRRRRKAT